MNATSASVRLLRHLHSMTATAREAARHTIKTGIAQIVAQFGNECLSLEQTVAYCKELNVTFNAGSIGTFQKGNTIHTLEVLPSGIVRLNRKKCLYLDFGNNIALLDFKNPSQRTDHAIALWSHKWTGFYHFLAEVFPKICRLQEDFGKDLGGAKLCYPRSHSSYENELLALLDVGNDMIIDTRASGGVQADRLSFVPIAGWFNVPPNISLVRKKLQPTEPTDGPERIYLSRQGRRRCLNEKQLLDALKPYHFTVLDESPRSIKEQIRLFRNARIMIGPHGSAFTNMMWCDPGARIVEFMPNTYNVAHHSKLSEACGHHYTKIMCQNGPAGVVGFTINFDADIPTVVGIVEQELQRANLKAV